MDELPVYQNLAEKGMLTEIHINPVYSPSAVVSQNDVDELYSDLADVTNLESEKAIAPDEAVYESAK